MSYPQPASPGRQPPRGHLLMLNRSFRRTLEAENKSPRTIEAYTDAVRLLASYCHAHGLPLFAGELKRAHLRAFIADQLARWKPTTAHNRYRGLRAFFMLVSHAGTLKVFDGSPPCHLKLIVEGMEETNSNLEAFVKATPTCSSATCSSSPTWGTSRSGSRPRRPPSVAMWPASSRCGRSSTRSILGSSAARPPDAMMALAKLLATLHDADGNVAVEGVSSFDWDGRDFSEQDLRPGPTSPRAWA